MNWSKEEEDDEWINNKHYRYHHLHTHLYIKHEDEIKHDDEFVEEWVDKDDDQIFHTRYRYFYYHKMLETKVENIETKVENIELFNNYNWFIKKISSFL